MLDEQRVERDPVALGHHLAQAGLRFLGSSGAHDPEAVRDPVDVGVDGDRRDPIAEDEHAVRRLRPDPGERRELGKGPRDGPAEPREYLARAVADEVRLRVVEPGPSDQRFDLGRPRRREARRVRVPSEEERARPVGRLVPRSLREDRADQHLERVLGVVAQVRPPPIPAAVELRQSIEDLLPIHPRPPRAQALRFGRRGVAGRSGAEETEGRPSTPGSERSGSSKSARPGFRSSPMR